MPASPDLAMRLAAAIARDGPIPIADYMAIANTHYYATRDPIGADGDFVTAPEISQMFGELIGLCLADVAARAGADRPLYVELGPGRGTLAADALRAMRGLAPEAHLVETSPVLRAAQAGRVPGATHHDDLSTLPADRPLLVVANEFFDALPVRQIVRTDDGWRERVVGTLDGRLAAGVGAKAVDAALPGFAADAAVGAVIESAPAAASVMRALARRLVAQGGAAIVVDYGYAAPALGDTLQAVSGHAPADPFAAPGTRDLTAHVDFAALLAAARDEGAVAHGPVSQGALLDALGIAARAEALRARNPARGAEIAAAVARLTGDAAMGTLFKAIAVTAPGWPVPAGFA